MTVRLGARRFPLPFPGSAEGLRRGRPKRQPFSSFPGLSGDESRSVSSSGVDRWFLFGPIMKARS